MVTGKPSPPKLVTAVDPSVSDTKTTTVMLNPFSTLPGGMCVLRPFDADAEDDNMVTITELEFSR